MTNQLPHIPTHSPKVVGSFEAGPEANGAPTDPPLYYISADKPGTRWDGVPIRIITGVAPHAEAHPASRYLDQPLFANDGGVIRPLGNQLINSEDCSPNFLLALADRVSTGDMPYPEEIRADTVEYIRSVFLEERHLECSTMIYLSMQI